MLGILLLYFIWKRFADLASDYDKPRRSNGWYGILSYLAGSFLAGIFLGILNLMFQWNIDWDNNYFLNLMAIPFGLLGCYVFYQILKKKWEKEYIAPESIDNIGVDNNQ